MRLAVVLVLLVIHTAANALPQSPRKQVLVLHSYSERLVWTRSISEGIAQGLGSDGWNLTFDYLDAKNVSPDFDFAAYDPVFEAKYAALRFDLVIAVDDTAYRYALRTQRHLFPGSRLVAIGLNGPPELRMPGVSYLLENQDYPRTVELALALYPDQDVVHFVVDRTLTGQIIRRSLEAATFSRRVAFDWIDEGSAEDVLGRCAALEPGSILVYALYFDPAQGYQSDDRLLRSITAVVQVPVFTFWTFHMEDGATGGYLLDGATLGADAAQVARRLLEGAPPAYRDGGQSRWTFDWGKLVRFGISIDSLAPGAEVINKPSDLWSIHRVPVIITGLVLVLLVFAILLVLFMLRLKHQKVVEGQRLITVQRALMTALGDVIETRSEETASHVQRITRLAVLLGTLADLSEEQLEQLEVCAPMHDIGKVGIPDAILKNPGRLSPEEMQTMRTHTTLGHAIFRDSPHTMLQVAAAIALEHHERWDGQGYPSGKMGWQIHPLARIVSVVDVFDALLTARVYKSAWEPEAVRTYLEDQAGRAFDPGLVDLVLAHWDTFLRVRDGHSPEAFGLRVRRRPQGRRRTPAQ